VPEPAPARPAVTMRKFAPAFPVSDLPASLAVVPMDLADRVHQ